MLQPSFYSPPMAPKDIDSDYLAEVDEYFSKPYVPLSSLPTPPLSSCSDEDGKKLGEAALDPELLGPAIHLTNMIPQSVSFLTPSVSIVHGMLTRASLPLETIALAVCMLDSLNSRFAVTWRRLCPVSSGGPADNFRSIRPEVIVLAALLLAAKYTDDLNFPTAYYADVVSEAGWTTKQINCTEACILENLDYRLAPLYEKELIDDAILDMQRAATGRNIYSFDYDSEFDEDADECDVEPCSPGGTVGTGTRPSTPKEMILPLPMDMGENFLPEAVAALRKTQEEMKLAEEGVECVDMLFPKAY